MMSAIEAKIMGISDASAWARRLQNAGKKLAVTNGVFDLLHRGHLQYLSEAASQADALLVAINSDASVKQLKGPERPIVNENDRAYMLASLECVSAVVIFNAPKPVEVFKAIHPNVYVKGGDYTEETLDREEHALLKAGGARFSFIKFVEGHSTTSVIRKIREGTEATVPSDGRLAPILSRRSVRKFQLRPVGRELLTELMKAAMAAPSACCKDPWHFEVVTKPETLKEIASRLPNGAFVANAGACICVIGDLFKAHGGELSYMLQDCSAATENILIAAPLLGLGACWLGVHPRQDRVDALRRIFGLPKTMVPVSCIAIGWPGDHPQSRTRYNESAVHFDF
ncbi:MAG: nitroreductase family protein [Victivallales bacterium]|nr:nitroreductase family protein [Victivallales bacterium]